MADGGTSSGRWSGRGRLAAAWRGGAAGGWLTRHSDLALAIGVMGIVATMIVPLPAPLLDLLVSMNLAGAVTLLLVSIYAGGALEISAFPTMLLLTTLFRVALEISATRLILLRANAGQVIHAFGSFVVAGNLVVGAVVFVILTVVQFIVIAKGAERVAEVAARFTLDALPGRQMAIDAELRAGHIDRAEADRRRSALARESQLFGAMDGAMKFVKGDAVAALVVLGVNIVGGLIIGVAQRGLDVSTAARTYVLLTIGEGLVAQIPALIISTAAGIIVTRVASEDGERTHLGQQIATQLLRRPKALAIAAGMLGVLALVPGLPFGPFIVLAAFLGFIARSLGGRRAGARSELAATSDTTSLGARSGNMISEAAAPLVTPIEVELGEPLAGQLGMDASDGEAFDDGGLADRLTRAVCGRLFEDLGLPLPPIRVRVAPSLADAEAAEDVSGYVIRINEVPLARGSIRSDETHPDDAEALLAARVLALLQRYGHELLGIEETQGLLARLERTHPALVREVVPKTVPLALLADVLRRLVEEGVSVRNLKDILGALSARAATPERDPTALTERVRAGLRRAITSRHASEAGVVSVLELDPMIEDAVRDSVHKTSGGAVLALEPQLSREIVESIGRALAAANANDAGDAAGATPVILVSADVRRHVRRLIEVSHPTLAVLSHPELAPEATVRRVGHVAPG